MAAWTSIGDPRCSSIARPVRPFPRKVWASPRQFRTARARMAGSRANSALVRTNAIRPSTSKAQCMLCRCRKYDISKPPSGPVDLLLLPVRLLPGVTLNALNIPSQTSTARTTVRRPSGMRVLFRAVSRHARKHGGHCRRVESRAPLRHHAARRDLDELPGTDGGAVVFLGRHPALRCTPQPRPLGSRIRTGALWRPCRGIPKRRARGLGRGLGRHRRPGRVPLVARRWRQQVAPELRPILSSSRPSRGSSGPARPA